MSLFNWSGKKPEVKLAELKDRADVLETAHPFSVKILQKGEEPPISAQIISKDYDYLTYVDTENANFYIEPAEIYTERDANGVLHRRYSPDREYSTSIDIADINTTALYDAIGTPCHGTFNKEYKPVLQVDTVLENELEKRLKELESKLAKTVSLVHNCANCGATLNIEENKPVIHCKYCGSAYIVGTARIYSNY